MSIEISTLSSVQAVRRIVTQQNFIQAKLAGFADTSGPISRQRRNWEEMIEAAGNDVDGISVWRTERDRESFKIRQFSGEDLRAAVSQDQEVR